MTAGLSWLQKTWRENKKDDKLLKDVISLVPRPSPASVFDCLQYAKMFLHTASNQKLEGEGLGTRLDAMR